MTRRHRAATATLAVLATLSLGFTTAPQSGAQEAEQGYIVLLDDTSMSSAASTAQAVERHGAEITTTYRTVLNGYAVNATSTEAKRLAAASAVRAVVPDGTVEAEAVQEDPPWHLDRLDQHLPPLDNRYEYPDSAGAGVTVYVLDTGVRITHQEFGGRASYGVDTTTGAPEAPDGNGHGTHIAGIIAGAEYGVAKKADVVAVKVLNDSGSGSISGVIEGIEWVTQNASGPSVANMSLGGAANAALDEAVRNAVAAGITFTVAAGGSNADASNYSPARVAEAITVATSDENDNRASFSNYGPVIDLFAPGTNITAAWNTSDTALNTLSGTSMSAAIVAGAAAIELGENPGSSPGAVDAALKSYAATGVVGNPGTGTPGDLVQVRPVG